MNKAGITEYSEVVARKLCNAYFSDNDFIDGKGIVKFTNIPQVNYFVLENLFSRWIGETSRLESAYFDYDHDDVREALSKFLNKLSHHIKMEREPFEALLRGAVGDTISLVMAPLNFIHQEYFDDDKEVITLDELKELSKYIKYNNFLIQKLIEKVESFSLEELPVKDLVANFEDIFEENKDQVVSVEELKDSLDAIEGTDKFKIFESYAKALDSKGASETEVSSDSTSDAEESFAEASDSNEVSSDSVEDTNTSHDETSKDISESEQSSVKALGTEEPYAKASASKTVNDSLKGKEYQFTLNDRFSDAPKEPTVLDSHRNQRISDLRSSIAINQKYSFVNGLFKGQSSDFEEVISRLDQCTSYEEAQALVEENYAHRYNWDVKNDQNLNSLMSLVKRKF